MNLQSIQNSNGGGLSVSLTGRYTSVRHELAKENGKLTSGQVAKHLSSVLNVKISAKELVNGYKVLYDKEPEWHHAGFYKSSGKSTMGRTFFFNSKEIDNIINDWHKLEAIISKRNAEAEILAKEMIFGFYWIWDSNYSGRYGKKVNFKVLKTYEGSKLNIPKNFTECTKEAFNNSELIIGQEFYGWDIPKI